MPVYKDKRRSTWYTSFYYTDWQGGKKRKKKEGFKTQREAKDYEREYINKSKTDCGISFKSLVEIYLEDCQSRLKPTTIENKKGIITLKILPFFKDMIISDIDTFVIRRWQNQLLLYVDEKGSHYSQTYLKTVNNQLSAIFNFACRYYKLTVNPVSLCGSIGKSRADTMSFWTLNEYSQFIPSFENKPMSKIIFELLFWTGIRSGELLALTLNDIDLDNKSLRINKNYSRLNGKDLILEPKTPKSKRFITLPQFLCDNIIGYSSKLKNYKPTERLFPVTKHYLNNEIKRGCRISGVKKIRVHDVRHSHASLLIELGFPPLLISERLGHEKIETTLQTYSHLYPNKHSQVADRLDRVVSNNWKLSED